MDAIFKALADPTRRLMLDRLRERNGQTLGELCSAVDMARQSATQHLGVLRSYERGPDGTFHDGLLMEMLAEEFIDRGDRPPSVDM